MQEIAIKILVAIGMKLLTDGFVSKVLVYSLRAAADKSGKQLPEEMVDAIAEALGVSEAGRQKKAS